MRIRILFFSVLRDVMNSSEMVYELQDSSSCEDLLNKLKAEYGVEDILNDSYLAKNGVYAYRDTLLMDGDELAILPPARGE